MKQITILGQVLELNGQEGYIDGYFEHPIFAQKAIIGFSNYDKFDDIPSSSQIRQLENFFEQFAQQQENFFLAVKRHFIENADEYFVDVEKVKMLSKLESDISNFSQYFQDPMIEIGVGGYMVFGYLTCDFDVEHGIVAAYNNNEISRIASVGELE